ncbi:MAG TPA: DUF58 domain-containing protein [Methylotenera sp.]|nr:DUF58 domain-containing protein [Methylotenera sp.]HPH05245.1 DUF58 domain-containing protein [Methylotenera sp.]HPN00147.1 DUF58 domain-containing protein [Methylotenera sp.]
MSAQFWPFTFWKRSWWQQWFRTAVSTSAITTLHPRVIYIVPTRWGILFGVMAFLMLLGSINYTLSLGFYLTFLLASLGIVAMFHTWLNFAHIEVEHLGAQPVFAGELAQVQLKISDKNNRTRYSIAIHFDQNTVVYADIAGNDSPLVAVPLATQQRGWLKLPKLVLHTEYPLGLFHAWSVIRNTQQTLVYAKPSEKNSLSSNNISAGDDKPHPNQMGDDDFNGHKNYQIGDTPSRLDWKASSRSVGLLTKQYSGNVQETLWLDWANTSGLAFEARISHLTKAVIDANAAHLTFGLKLPETTIQPSRGSAHYHACLQALALL